MHRARRALESRRRRSDVSPEEHRALLERFLAACSGHDVDGLAALLARDAVAHTDGGGEARAARQRIHGRERVARFLVGVTKKAPPGLAAEIVPVNGREGVLLRAGDAVLAVVDVVAVEGLVTEILVVAAPSKLRAAAPL